MFTISGSFKNTGIRKIIFVATLKPFSYIRSSMGAQWLPVSTHSKSLSPCKGPFCVAFACSLHVSEGFFWIFPTIKNMLDLFSSAITALTQDLDLLAYLQGWVKCTGLMSLYI